MIQDKSTTRSNSVVILAFPARDPSAFQFVGLSKLAIVLAASVDKVFIVTGNLQHKFSQQNISVINVSARTVSMKKEPLFSSMIRFFSIQFTITAALFNLQRKLNNNSTYVINFDPEAILLPILIVKLFRFRLFSVLRAHTEEVRQVRKNINRKPLSYIRRMNLKLSDRIIIYLPSLVEKWSLEKYKDKILVAPYIFIDSSKFKPERPFKERKNCTIAYIGRLAQEKGIANFLQALPILIGIREDIKVLIAGDGQLRVEIEQFLEQAQFGSKVNFISGWIDHDTISEYLNRVSLLLLPSYSEGLPNILLEAMACGTPVLATKVGAIPDIIEDGETGFTMNSNSPECIAENTLRALECPHLDKIANRARAFIEKKYSFEAMLDNYQKIFKAAPTDETA